MRNNTALEDIKELTLLHKLWEMDFEGVTGRNILDENHDRIAYVAIILKEWTYVNDYLALLIWSISTLHISLLLDSMTQLRTSMKNSSPFNSMAEVLVCYFWLDFKTHYLMLSLVPPKEVQNCICVHGTCNDEGVCICNEGYVGSSCDVEGIVSIYIHVPI